MVYIMAQYVIVDKLSVGWMGYIKKLFQQLLTFGIIKALYPAPDGFWLL